VSQPIFALTPYWCVLSGERVNTIVWVFEFDAIGFRTYDLPHSNQNYYHYSMDMVGNNEDRFTFLSSV